MSITRLYDWRVQHLVNYKVLTCNVVDSG